MRELTPIEVDVLRVVVGEHPKRAYFQSELNKQALHNLQALGLARISGPFARRHPPKHAFAGRATQSGLDHYRSIAESTDA